MPAIPRVENFVRFGDNEFVNLDLVTVIRFEADDVAIFEFADGVSIRSDPNVSVAALKTAIEAALFGHERE